MKVIELEKNKVRVNMYFDPDEWNKLQIIADKMTEEAGRRITRSTLTRIAIRDLIKKLTS